MLAQILIVEDEPNMVAGLRDNFEYEGYEVITATDGVAGLECALKSTPDLVILDVMMPDMDGYETMKEIRKVPEFRTLPILALTAKAMKGDREKCLDAGASDYIAKPVSLRVLRQALARTHATRARSGGWMACAHAEELFVREPSLPQWLI